MTSYAKAYSFGASGSATLAGSLASIRPLSVPKKRARAPFAVRVPLWSVIVSIAAILCVLSFVLLGLRSQATETAKSGNALRGALAHVQEVNDALEIRINEANDPARIHSIAQNKLGMHQPGPEQIVRVLRAQTTRAATGTKAVQSEGGGFFRTLLEIIGL